MKTKSFPPRAVGVQSSLPTIGLILATSAVLIGSVLLLHSWKGIPIGRLTRDPVQIAELPFYTGFLSQIGIFLWSASAAVCVFGARALSRRSDGLKIRRFLFTSGVLTLVLVFDDAFLLHEQFLPYYVGVPQVVVYVSYFGLMVLYLIAFGSTILETDWIFLGMALGFFGVSIALDCFGPPSPYLYLHEDGAKAVGIVSWLSYFSRVSGSVVYCDAAQ